MVATGARVANQQHLRGRSGRGRCRRRQSALTVIYFRHELRWRNRHRLGPAAPAPASTGLVRLTIEGANINTRFRTALPCSLAFRDSVRFTLVAADAGIDIDAAIGRLNLRRGASDDGEGQQGKKHYSLHDQSSFRLGRRIVNLVQHLPPPLVADGGKAA